MNKLDLTNSFYGRNLNSIDPKVKKILDLDVSSSYPEEIKHYSEPVNDYIRACKPSLVQGIRQDILTNRNALAACNRAYSKVEVFTPLFYHLANDPRSEPDDAELMMALSLYWIVETVETCRTCPASTDPRRCTGLCVKWGIVPK